MVNLRQQNTLLLIETSDIRLDVNIVCKVNREYPIHYTVFLIDADLSGADVQRDMVGLPAHVHQFTPGLDGAILRQQWTTCLQKLEYCFAVKEIEEKAALTTSEGKSTSKYKLNAFEFNNKREMENNIKNTSFLCDKNTLQNQRMNSYKIDTDREKGYKNKEICNIFATTPAASPSKNDDTLKNKQRSVISRKLDSIETKENSNNKEVVGEAPRAFPNQNKNNRVQKRKSKSIIIENEKFEGAVNLVLALQMAATPKFQKKREKTKTIEYINEKMSQLVPSGKVNKITEIRMEYHEKTSDLTKDETNSKEMKQKTKNKTDSIKNKFCKNNKNKIIQEEGVLQEVMTKTKLNGSTDDMCKYCEMVKLLHTKSTGEKQKTHVFIKCAATTKSKVHTIKFTVQKNTD